MSNTTSESSNEQGFTSQKLNFILAVCAILISAASFYATYLQASAAEKQVKAMTLPLLQYETSNLEEGTNKQVLQFTIANGGVGPALIKSMDFSYKNKPYKNLIHIFKACCNKEYEDFLSIVTMDFSEGGYITSPIVNTILPAQEEIKFYQLYDGNRSHALWEKLNVERDYIDISICYCSLLDECYQTAGNGQVNAIQSCPVIE